MDMDKNIVQDDIQGFGYIDKSVGSINVSGFTFGAGATRNYNATLTAHVDDATSLTRVKFSGIGNSGLNNIWVMLYGSLYFRNFTPNYDVAIIIERTATGQLAQLQFYNPTGGNVTVPNITVDLESYYYDTAW